MEIWEVEEAEASIQGLLEDGSADPAYAAALGLVPAPPGRRAAAAAIDVVVYLILQVPFWVWTAPLVLKFLQGRISGYGFVNHPDFVLAMIMGGITAALTTAYCLMQLALHGRRGVTLGKALLGIRSVNVKTLERPGFWRVVLRALVLWGSSLVPFALIAFLASPLFDPQRRGRGWHDLVGGTWLVDVRAGLHPYDEKRMRIARKTVAATPRAERSALPSLTTSPDSPAGYQPGARLSAGVLGRSAADGQAGPPGVTPAGGSLATPASTPPPPAAPAPPAPAPAAPAPAPPAAAAAPPPVAPETPPVFVLHLDTGQQVRIDGVVLLGRNPESADPTQVRPIAIVDEERSVSKAHLLVRPGAQGIELIDRNSSNGTTLTHQGIQRALVPGEPALAVLDDTIQIGQRTAMVRRG